MTTFVVFLNLPCDIKSITTSFVKMKCVLGEFFFQGLDFIYIMIVVCCLCLFSWAGVGDGDI